MIMFSVHLMGAQIQTLAHCEVQTETNKQTNKDEKIKLVSHEDNHKLKKAFSSSSFQHTYINTI